MIQVIIGFTIVILLCLVIAGAGQEELSTPKGWCRDCGVYLVGHKEFQEHICKKKQSVHTDAHTKEKGE